MTAIILFIVGILLAIMLHEWGHFWTARRFGMRADRFFLGFGPTLWSIRRGETEYGVKAIPAGGFVRIKGMSELDERLPSASVAVFDPDALSADHRRIAARLDEGATSVPLVPSEAWDRARRELRTRGVRDELADRIVDVARARAGDDPTVEDARHALDVCAAELLPKDDRVGSLRHRVLRGDEGRFFHDRPAWQRAIVLVAGSTMHFIQAIVLLIVFYAVWGTQAAPVVGQVVPETPAAAAGVVPGDRIVAVDGIEVDSFDELSALIRERGGIEAEFTIERGSQLIVLLATPVMRENPSTGETYAQFGFVPDGEDMTLTDAVRATFVGESSVPASMVYTVRAIGQVFGPEGVGAIFQQVTGDAERDAAGAISAVGAARAADEGTAVLGIGFLFILLASINVFVGVFNLLPLPPLDGGHLAVLGIERVVNGFRRLRGEAADFALDPRAIAAVALPVIVFIGTISIALVWLDITNPARLPLE